MRSTSALRSLRSPSRTDAGDPVIVIENQYVRVTQGGTVRIKPAHPVILVDIARRAVEFHDGLTRSLGEHQLAVQLLDSDYWAPEPLDAVRVDPVRFDVVLENDVVRVVCLAFDGNETGPMVHHPSRVLITLTDVWVRVTLPDGQSDERRGPAGVAAWLDAETLQTENLGHEAIKVILVEPKNGS